MNILHITFSMQNAGKENLLVDLANEQGNLKHDVSIVVVNQSIDPCLENRIEKYVRLYKLNRKRKSLNLLPILNLLKILYLEIKPHIIHSHDPQLGFLLKYIIHIPTILTIHGPAFPTNAMKYYTKLVAVSEAVKDDINQRSNITCDVIYNGVKISNINQKENLNIPKNKFNIITIGRLDHEFKGQDLLIEAVRILVHENGYSEIKVFIFGDGSSRIFLQNLCRKYALSENIFFEGNKERAWLYKNLANYDLLVQPSRLEGFGLAVIEAMAAKVPVLTSNIEGPNEILQNGRYGYTFKNNDIKDLALEIEKIKHLYEKNLIRKATEQSYAYCKEHFNITRTAQKYCAYYKSITEV